MKNKGKKKNKRKISIFTILLWIVLITTMTVITINGISRSDALDNVTRTITLKIDFSEYLSNENYEDYEWFLESYASNIILTQSNNIDYDYYEVEANYLGSENGSIGIYEVEVLEDAKYYVLDYYNSTINNHYNLVNLSQTVEEIVENNEVYHGFKIENELEEYSIKLVEKERKSVRIKIDFSEYLANENIVDEYDIEKLFEYEKYNFIALNEKNINKPSDYNTNLYNKYRGNEENKIGIYDVEVPEGAKYIALNFESIYYDILSNDYEIVKVKNNYKNKIYNGIKLKETLEECNIKLVEKEKRTLRVKVDFSEYLANENIVDENEIENILNNYKKRFFISSTNNVNDDEYYGGYYTDLIYQYIGSENGCIGIYDISFLKELEANYLGVYNQTSSKPEYYVTNEDSLVQYIYIERDVYYCQKLEDNINEYKFKLKVNNEKILRLDINEVNDLIDLEEYSINTKINNCVFSNASLIEANDNFATFSIYTPKDIDFDIVFDEKYKVFENDLELEKDNKENSEGYIKRIKVDNIEDSYNFKLSKIYVEVNIKANGIENITEQIDYRFKNLNIEVRNENNEILDKLYFLDNSSNVYKYISNKIYDELEYKKLYIELDDLEEYSIVEYYEKTADNEFYDYNNMTYNNYNIEKNKWEHEEYVGSELNYTINYKNSEEYGDKKEKIIKFSEVIGDNIPKEVYENIIIFHKGSKWTFDRSEGKQYIYKIVATDFSYDSNEYDIYIPKILDNNIKAKLENNEYLCINNEAYNDYIVLGNEIEFCDNIIIQNSDENTGIYKNIEFLDNNHARLDFSYIAFASIGKYRNRARHDDEFYNSYISENGNGYNDCLFSKEFGVSSRSFILFKENLPKDFKVSDEYINSDEWVFLDNISDEEYYLPDCKSNGLSLNKDVMNEFIEKLKFDNISSDYVDYTGKKYVYVRSTNTVYYLVDIIGIFENQSINLEYTGNDNIEKEYIVNNDIDAYYVVIEMYSMGETSDFYKSYINKYNLTEVEVEKRWEDNDNINRVRPDSIVAELKKNGETVKEKRLSNLNNWRSKIYYVPGYDYKIVKNEDGENIVDERKIEYTIDEKAVSPYYEKEIEGNVITNKYIDKGEYINLNVDKKWIDENNKYNMRPSSIIVQIYDKDKLVAEEIISEESDWKCSFKLPKYDEKGKEIEYRVDEKERNVNELKYYDKKIEGNSIINTLTYKEEVDTSDINIWMYGFMFIVVFVVLVLVLFIIRKNKVK